jgi:hypothetical protein
MPLRSDISIADEVSSFTNTDFSSVGGPNPMGKNWMGKKARQRLVELNIEPTRNNLTRGRRKYHGLFLNWHLHRNWGVLSMSRSTKHEAEVEHGYRRAGLYR